MSKLKFYQTQPFEGDVLYYDVTKKRLFKDEELIAKVTFVPNSSLNIVAIKEISASDLSAIRSNFNTR